MVFGVGSLTLVSTLTIGYVYAEPSVPPAVIHRASSTDPVEAPSPLSALCGNDSDVRVESESLGAAVCTPARKSLHRESASSLLNG